jgi:hypothetical protein
MRQNRKAIGGIADIRELCSEELATVAGGVAVGEPDPTKQWPPRKGTPWPHPSEPLPPRQFPRFPHNGA